MTIGRAPRVSGAAVKAKAAVRSSIAAAISQASMPRTPAPVPLVVVAEIDDLGAGRRGSRDRRRCGGCAAISTRFGMPRVSGRATMRAASQRARHAAVARVSAAAAPEVTMPASAPVAFAMTRLLAACNSAISTEAPAASRMASSTRAGHQAAAEAGQRAGGVDPALDADPRVNIAHAVLVRLPNASPLGRKWQATKCPGLTSVKGGSSVLQRATA